MDHYFDSHSVLLLRERLERKRLRQWLRLQQRLRRLLLTGHDIEDAINKNIPWVPRGAQGYYYAHPRHTIKSRPSQNISPTEPGSAGGRAAVRTALSWKRKMLGWWRDWVYSNMTPSLL